MEARKADSTPDKAGLFEQLRSLAGGGAEYFEARLELLRIESQEAIRSVLKGAAGLVVVAMAAQTCVLLILAAIAVAIRDQTGWPWPYLFVGMGVVHALVAAAIAGWAIKTLKKPLLTATISELEKDRSWIHGAQPPKKN